MSDQFKLCGKCGEEVDWFGFVEGKQFWYCSNCEIILDWTMLREVTTEYFGGVENMQVKGALPGLRFDEEGRVKPWPSVKFVKPKGEENEQGNQSRRSKK